MKEDFVVDKENPITHFSSCFRCNRRLKIECYSDNFTRRKNVTFLGRLGEKGYSYCPYCGAVNSSFAPYDDNGPVSVSNFDNEEDDDDEMEINDWSKVPALDDEDIEEEEPLKMYPMEETETFTCPSCGESFRTGKLGFDRIFCYYCGKRI